MLEKNKKILVGALGTIAVAGTALAITLPLVLTDDSTSYLSKDSLEFKAIKNGGYLDKAQTASADVTKAKDSKDDLTFKADETKVMYASDGSVTVTSTSTTPLGGVAPVAPAPQVVPVTASSVVVFKTHDNKAGSKEVYIDSINVTFTDTTKEAIDAIATVDKVSKTVTYQDKAKVDLTGDLKTAIEGINTKVNTDVHNAADIVKNQKELNDITGKDFVDAILGGKDANKVAASTVDVNTTAKDITIKGKTYEYKITKSSKPSTGTTTDKTFDLSINFKDASTNTHTYNHVIKDITIKGMLAEIKNVDIYKNIHGKLDDINVQAYKAIAAIRKGGPNTVITNTSDLKKFFTDKGITIADLPEIPNGIEIRFAMSSSINLPQLGAGPSSGIISFFITGSATGSIDNPPVETESTQCNIYVKVFNKTFDQAKDEAQRFLDGKTNNDLKSVGDNTVEVANADLTNTAVKQNLDAIFTNQNGALPVYVKKTGNDAAKGEVDITVSYTFGTAPAQKIASKDFTIGGFKIVKPADPNQVKVDEALAAVKALTFGTTPGKTIPATNPALLTAAALTNLGITGYVDSPKFHAQGLQVKFRIHTQITTSAPGTIHIHIIINNKGTGIDIPLSLQEAAHWEKGGSKISFPQNTLYQLAGSQIGDHKYTTHKSSAEGYTLGNNPAAVLLPQTTTAGDTVTIDGQVVTSVAGAKSWDKPFPAVVYAKGNDFVTDKTQADGYSPEQTQVKPKMYGTTEITSLNGGESYNVSKWSWDATTSAVAGTDHLAETKPSIGNISIRGLAGGTIYNASNWTWNQTQAPVAGDDHEDMVQAKVKRVTITSSQGGENYDNSKWTWALATGANQTGTPGADAVTLVKEKIGTTEITNSTGAKTYDANKWTWEQTDPGQPGGPDNAATPTKVNNVDVNLDGVQTYDPSNWTYTGTAAANGGTTDWHANYNGADTGLIKQTTGAAGTSTTVNATFGGVDLGATISGAPADDATKAAVIDALAGKITAVDSATGAGVDTTATFATGAGSTPIEVSGVAFNTDFATTFATPADKAKLYDALVATNPFVDQSTTTGSPTDAVKPADGTVPTGWTASKFVPGADATPNNGSPATYTAKYDGTSISTYTKQVAYTGATLGAIPGTHEVPFGFTEATDYHAGTSAVSKKDGTPYIYVASYDGTPIPTLTQSVANNGAQKGAVPSGAPTSGFTESADYEKGNQLVNKNDGTPGIYQAVFAGTTITGKVVTLQNTGSTVPNAPTGAPASFDTTSYHIGNQDKPVDNGTSGVYQAKYNGVPISGKVVTLNNNGSSVPNAPTGAPTGFNEATDYVKGNPHELEQVPSAASIDLQAKQPGDTVNVDGTSYSVISAVAFPVSGPFYPAVTTGEFVKDITQAKGYASAMTNPSPVTVATDGTITPITIDNDIYTWIDPSASTVGPLTGTGIDSLENIYN